MGRTMEVDLREILSCYEEPFIPAALRELAKTKPESCTFMLLPFSDADYLARLQKVDELRPAEEDAAKRASAQEVRGQMVLIVKGGNRLMCSTVRQFVRPPAHLKPVWDWKPEGDEEEGGVADPLMGLPFVGELSQAVNRKYESSTKLLKDSPEAAAETAAGK